MGGGLTSRAEVGVRAPLSQQGGTRERHAGFSLPPPPRLLLVPLTGQPQAGARKLGASGCCLGAQGPGRGCGEELALGVGAHGKQHRVLQAVPRRHV